jgi:hypothetical protein
MLQRLCTPPRALADTLAASIAVLATSATMTFFIYPSLFD